MYLYHKRLRHREEFRRFLSLNRNVEMPSFQSLLDSDADERILDQVSGIYGKERVFCIWWNSLF